MTSRHAFGSLRSRLFLATALIVVVSVGITLSVGTVLTRRSVERATLKDLSRLADVVAAQERGALRSFSSRRAGVRDLLRSQGARFAEVTVSRPSRFLSSTERAAVLDGRPVDGTKTIAGERSFFAARIVICPAGAPACRERSKTPKSSRTPKALVLLKPARVSGADWRPFLTGLLYAALVGATLAAAAAVLLARAIARPLGRVAGASRRLAEGESPDPLPIEGPDELATLASSFNHMAAQLAKARAAERSFLLSVSHELKTPLTAVRGYAEALSDGAFEPHEAGETIAREAGRLERLVRDLLDLARMNKSEFSVHSEPLELEEVVHEVAQRYDAHARCFGIELEAEARKGAVALGDPDRVLQVVSNLVENALRLTPPGGTVRVIADRGSLFVEDTGPGLRPEELPRAFERFFLYSRYGAERPVGTGLGLAIVKELTSAMNGSVEVESEIGRGTRFTVRLPVPRGDVAGRPPAQTPRDLTPTARG